MRRTLYPTSHQHAVEAKSCTSIPDSSPTEAIAADGTRNFALPPGLTANGQIHAGGQRVISAPGKGALKTLGMDVNQTQHDKEANQIVSDDPRTTNCIAPFGYVSSQEGAEAVEYLPNSCFSRGQQS